VKKVCFFVLGSIMMAMVTTPALAVDPDAFCDAVFDTAMTVAEARTKGYPQTAVMQALNSNASNIDSEVYAVTSMIINEQYKYAPDAAAQLMSVQNLYNNCLKAITK
jgi:hypothetical protein